MKIARLFIFSLLDERTFLNFHIIPGEHIALKGGAHFLEQICYSISEAMISAEGPETIP